MTKKGPQNTPLGFSHLLLKWNRKMNARQMPWKGEKDPYKIWLSEIILQQTRVEQGLSYYNRFVEAFPDIHRLAGAPDEKIFKLWEGLGYYSRCRNLIFTAKYISKELHGIFPRAYEEIKKLKGVGPYTAAAISSFAYNLPYAVVDGNVFRVLARVAGIRKETDTTEGKRFFNELAASLLDKKQPGIYNQAIMDFGAVICKPAAPQCSVCIFHKTCVAFRRGWVNELPVKKKKLQIRKRWFSYLVFEYKGKTAIRQRTGKDIWHGLFEFPLIESEKELSDKEIIQEALIQKWMTKGKHEILPVSASYKQQLTHQLIKGRFISIRLQQRPQKTGNWIWVNKKQLAAYTFPRLIHQFMQEKTRVRKLF